MELKVGTWAVKCKFANGFSIIALFPNTVGYGKGKSIISEVQCEDFGTVIDKDLRRNGGK